MKKTKKLLALLLAVTMVIGLVACKSKDKAKANDTLVVSIEQGLEGKFSPFFSLSAADTDVVDFVSLGAFPVDRVGNPILQGMGKDGETRSYNGKDYTYYAVSNVEITENEDGTVYYDMTMRDDIKFSDGSKANIDDVIFGLYVVLDPTYDGNQTMYSLPIEGLEEYRSGMTALYALLVEAGPENTDFSKWEEATQKNFWEKGLPKAGEAFAQSIVDYVKLNGYNGADDSVADCAASWNYTLEEKATLADFFDAMVEEYDGDYNEMSDAEAADRALWSCLDSEYTVGIVTGESAPNVSGIQRTGDYSLRIVTTELDATMIYQLGVYIAPLSYYGDKAQYDYENNQFGFTKGDLSIVKSKTTQPVGAGPYVFKSYKNGTVHLEANPYYFLGEPKIKSLDLRETDESNKVSGIVAGTLDIADPSYDTNTAKQIAKENGLDDWQEFNGKVLTTKLIDYRGYGYAGVNPNLVKVGDDPYSDASKNLRKAIATVLAVYRDEAIDSYYGNTASVINYPISNTSWAAPQTTDDGYRIAYSVDVNGEPIYTADMKAEQKYEAALNAALGYFEAAGYTITDGKITAAPEGAKTNYQVNLGGGGEGAHPCFLLLKNAAAAFETIGFTLNVNDMANANELYASYQTGKAELWLAAWQAAADPDMFQLYHSSGSTNYYQISDAQLDQLIMDGRASTDPVYRKSIYKSAMEIILDYAVEIPMYQRSEAIVVSSERVDVNTLPKDMTPYWGWAAEIHNLKLK